MPFDPNLPANNSLVSSAELREQLNALKALYDALAAQMAGLSFEVSNRVTYEELNVTLSGTAANVDGVEPTTVEISNPPESSEVDAIRAKVNELITNLHR